jgi:hypothetical protein
MRRNFWMCLWEMIAGMVFTMHNQGKEGTADAKTS